MSFFKWAQAEFKLHGNPVVPIRSPRLRDVERDLFSAEDVVRIVAAQPELRDRVALKLLFLMGLVRASLQRSVTAISTSGGGGSASMARAARSGTRRFRPRSSARSWPNSRSAATRKSTSSTRRSAGRKER